MRFIRSLILVLFAFASVSVSAAQKLGSPRALPFLDTAMTAIGLSFAAFDFFADDDAPEVIIRDSKNHEVLIPRSRPD